MIFYKYCGLSLVESLLQKNTNVWNRKRTAKKMKLVPRIKKNCVVLFTWILFVIKFPRNDHQIG